MEFFRQMLVIAGKDLRAELRTKEAINASLAFALVILLLFSFAFDPSDDTTREISGGLLWIVFAFAGTLVLNRSFAREVPNPRTPGRLSCRCLGALRTGAVSSSLQPGDIESALNAANQIGDDKLQSKAGHVRPDTFTHGTSKQRMYWFKKGFDTGDAGAALFDGVA